MTYLVRHVMATDLKTATPEMGPADAAGLMASHGIGAVPIVDAASRPLGVVTDRDLVIRVLAVRADPSTLRLENVATRRSLSTISPDATVAQARNQMASDKVKRLLVVKGDELVGIVSLGDLAQVSASDRAIGETVSDVFDTGAAERAKRRGAPDLGTPTRVLEHRGSRDKEGDR